MCNLNSSKKHNIMKTNILILAGLLILLGFNTFSQTNIAPKSGSIHIISSPELYNLSANLVKEYNVIHPGVKIDLTKMSNIKSDVFQNSETSICFVIGEYANQFNDKTVHVDNP